MSAVKKAQDAMMANSAPPPPNNMEAMRQGFFDACRVFGERAGAGDTSKVGWFQATVEAAWMGHISPSGRKKPDAPPGDAEIAYKTYAEARKKKAGEMGKKIMGFEASGKGVRISEANRMIALGCLPLIHDVDSGGLGVFNRALRIIREEDAVKGQVDNLLLEVARRQCDGKQNSTPLTDDQLKEILIPPDAGEPVPKTEVELWGLVLRQVESIMNTKFPDTAGVDPMAKQARNSIVNRYEALGGKTATVKARAEAAAAETPEQAEHKKARQVQRQGARGAKKAASNKKKR